MSAAEAGAAAVSPVEQVHVLIVDDAPMWRETIHRDLEGEPDMTVIAEAGNGEQAVELAREHVPDVVLMDLAMPVMSGIEATRRIHEELPAIRVLVLTQLEEDEDVLGALRAGAVGYLLKETSAEELIRDVRRVFQGEVVFTPRLANLVLAEFQNPTRERPAPSLTDREVQILRYLAQGHTDQEIAKRFELTAHAVRNEVRSIVFKLRGAIRPIPTKPRPGPVVHEDEIKRRPSPDRWRHPLRLSARAKLALGVVAAVAGLVVLGAVAGRLAAINRSILRLMANLRGHSLTQLMRVVSHLGSPWTIGTLRISVIVALIFYRRWQHLLAFIASFLLVGWLVSVIATGAGPIHIVDRFAPSAPVAGLTVSLFGVAYGVASSDRPRQIVFGAAAALVVVLGLADVYLGLTSFSGAVASMVTGSAIPILVFGFIAPEVIFPITYRRRPRAWLPIDDARKEAIGEAIQEQLGMTVMEVKPLGAEGAAGSTPLVIRVQGNPSDMQLFGKLYATSHMRSDRLYKLARMALYGSLEDEKPFNSVRRLAEYEDYILRYMEDSGIRTADPYGVVELDPELQYLLVTEFLDGSEPLLHPTEPIDRGTVHDALSLVRGLWEAGLAHRDIKPSNLLVREGKVYLIDAAFCQVRPSPWRQAVDLANMMLVLALQVDPRIVYQEALGIFTEDEIAEAFAATHSVTMPAQVREEIKKDGRDLVGTFRRLAPSRKPIGIQRWTVRRVAVTVGGLAVVGIAGALVYGNVHRLLTH